MNELDDFRTGRAQLAREHPLYPREPHVTLEALDILKSSPNKACFLATCDGGLTRCVLKAARQGLDLEYRFLAERAEMFTGMIPYPISYWERDGVQYLLRQYVTGQTLSELYQDEAPIPQAKLKRIIDALVDALNRLHTAGLVHRDLKPDNILWTEHETCVFIDIETFRTPQPGKLCDTVNIGTRAYASPEQLCDLQTDTRSDVYGLGRVLLYLITGSDVDTDAKRVRGRIGRVIRRCTAFSPEKRYPSVLAFRRALKGKPALTAAIISLTVCALAMLGVVVSLQMRSIVYVGKEPLQSVIDRIEPDRTVTLRLTQDAVVTEPLAVVGCNVILEGSAEIIGQVNDDMITIAPGASLTIRDGISITSDSAGVLISNNGHVALEGGILSLSGDTAARVAIDCRATGNAELNRGLIRVNALGLPENGYAECLLIDKGSARLTGAHLSIINCIQHIGAVLNRGGNLVMTGGSVFADSPNGVGSFSIATMEGGVTTVTGGEIAPEIYTGS